MNKLFKIVLLGLLATACGGTTENRHHGNTMNDATVATYGDDPVVVDAPSEADLPPDATNGSTIGGSPADPLPANYGAGSDQGGAASVADGGAAGISDQGEPEGEGGEASIIPNDCSPHVVMTYVSHSAAMVQPGSDDVPTYTFTLMAKCMDLEVSRMDFHLFAWVPDEYDSTSFRNGPVSNPNAWYFRDFKVKEAATGSVIAGPLDHPEELPQPARLMFTDSVMLKRDEPKVFVVTLDVASSFPSDLEGTRYTVTHLIVDAGNAYFEMDYPEDFANPWPSFTVTAPSPLANE
jgi:hypothetical protein